MDAVKTPDLLTGMVMGIEKAECSKGGCPSHAQQVQFDYAVAATVNNHGERISVTEAAVVSAANTLQGLATKTAQQRIFDPKDLNQWLRILTVIIGSILTFLLANQSTKVEDYDRRNLKRDRALELLLKANGINASLLQQAEDVAGGIQKREQP
jgi:hypothetical protein